MFRPPLRLALPGAIFIAGIAILLALSAMDVWRSYRLAEHAVLNQSRVLGTIQSAGLDSAYRRNRQDEARTVFRRASSDRNLEHALLIDDRERVLLSNVLILRDRALVETPLAHAAQRVTEVSRTRRAQVSVTDDGMSVIGVFPVALAPDSTSLLSSRTGALVLSHRLQSTKRAVLEREIRFMGSIALMLSVLCLVVWRALDRVLMRRVDALVRAAERFAAGAPPEPVDTRGTDEIAHLAQALSTMTAQLHGRAEALRTSGEFLDAMLDAVPANIAVMDGNGVILRVNLAWRTFGDANDLQAPGHAVGANYLEVCDQAAALGDRDAAVVAQMLREVIAEERDEAEFEYECSSPGEERYFSLHIVRFAAEGEPLILTSHVDVTETRISARATALAERRYRTLYHDSPAMFFTLDQSGTIVSVNAFGAEQLGYEVEELLGRHVDMLYDAESARVVGEEINHCFSGVGDIRRWEATKRRQDGTELRVRETGRRVLEAGGNSTMLVVCEDISEAHELSRELKYLASHDALTGLINRYEFERRIEHAVEIARTDDAEHVLAYIDLDQFKVINDTSGHAAGDELLRQVAQLLRKQLRRHDTLARLGGDEFGVLMEHCSVEQGRKVAGTLCSVVEDFRFVWEGRPYGIGASIGLAPIRADTIEVAEVLSAADSACYAAKDAGRNRVHVHEPEDADTARRQGDMQWLTVVQEALDQDRMELFCQRIAPCTGQSSMADSLRYEILIRLRDKDGSLIGPGAFLPAVERFGLAHRLDHWVIRKTFDWLAAHPAHVKVLKSCSINLSGQTLGSPDFVNTIGEALRERAIPPGKICFELTETAAVANMTRAAECIDGLRALGCRFAIDDFGTGMSSFGYLKHLPVDYLKIDGVFVKDIATDALDEAMVRSINHISHVLGKETIAEFVENDAIIERLTAIGVDYLQGYGIHMPCALDELDEELALGIATPEAVSGDR